MISLIMVLGTLVGMVVVLLFIILLDRKILGSIQGREGPVVVSFFGFLQAPIDGMKIFFKSIVFNRFSNKMVFFIAPLFVFFLSTIGWTFIPLSAIGGVFDFNYDLLIIYTLMSLGVLGFVLAAWAALSSNFPVLGAVREVVQMLAYELLIGFVFLILMLFTGTMGLRGCVAAQHSVWFIFLLTPAAFLFYVVIIAELHRTPFDLSEAEAELTAGYQTEHGGSAFSAFFLAEYNNVFILASVFTWGFVGGWLSPLFFFGAVTLFSLKVVCVIWSCILVRGALPRTRWTTFLYTAWSSLLPAATNLVLFYLWVAFWFRVTCPSEYRAVLSDKYLRFFISIFVFLSVSGWLFVMHQRATDPITLEYGRASMSLPVDLPFRGDQNQRADSVKFFCSATGPQSRYPDDFVYTWYRDKRTALTGKLGRYNFGLEGPDSGLTKPSPYYSTTAYPTPIVEAAEDIADSLYEDSETGNLNLYDHRSTLGQNARAYSGLMREFFSAPWLNDLKRARFWGFYREPGVVRSDKNIDCLPLLQQIFLMDSEDSSKILRNADLPVLTHDEEVAAAQYADPLWNRSRVKYGMVEPIAYDPEWIFHLSAATQPGLGIRYTNIPKKMEPLVWENRAGQQRREGATVITG